MRALLSLTLWFLLVLMLSLSLLAGIAGAKDVSVTLAWDANTEEDLAYYQIFQAEILLKENRSTELQPVGGQIQAGTETLTVTVDNNRDWVWCAIAVDTSGNKSMTSNLAFMIDKVPPGRMGGFKGIQAQ